VDFTWIIQYTPMIAHGVFNTVWISLLSTALGILISIALAWVRVYGPKVLSGLIMAYVEIIRNTPFLVQLYFVYFGLPALGAKLTATECAIAAVVLNLSAYLTEIIRAGIDAVPHNLSDAARSLGFSRLQAYRHIVLVPAFNNVFSAVTSQCIVIMLGTAAISQVSVPELTYVATFIQTRNFRSFETFIMIAAIYLGLSILMRRTFFWVRRTFFRYAAGRKA
jgi:polar amino acid transport system permease protein